MNEMDDGGLTILADTWDPASAAVLLAGGADPERWAGKGYSILTAAYVEKKSIPLVKALLQGGANHDARDGRGRRLAEYATERGDEEMLAFIAAGRV